jgi:hypothetical protein
MVHTLQYKLVCRQFLVSIWLSIFTSVIPSVHNRYKGKNVLAFRLKGAARKVVFVLDY